MNECEPGSLEQAKNDPDGWLEWWEEIQREYPLDYTHKSHVRLTHVAHALKAQRDELAKKFIDMKTACEFAEDDRDRWRGYAEKLEVAGDDLIVDPYSVTPEKWIEARAIRPKKMGG